MSDRISASMSTSRYKSALDERVGDFTSTDIAGEVSGETSRLGVAARQIQSGRQRGVDGEVSVNSPPEMGK